MQQPLKNRAIRLDTTKDFLDKLMQVYGLKTDYQLHQLLGVSKTTIYRYRDKGTFDETVALKVALLLRQKEVDIPDAYILTCMAIETSKLPPAIAAWGEMKKQIQGAMKEAAKHGFKVVAPVLIGLAALGGVPEAHAGSILHNSGANTHSKKRRFTTMLCV